MHTPWAPQPRGYLGTLLLLPLVAANGFDCKSVVAGGHPFDLSPLSGPRSVSHIENLIPNTLNTTYTIDICKKLARPKGSDKSEQCPDGTWICGISELITPESTLIEHVLPISREFTHDGAHLEPDIQKLPDSKSNADSQKEGVRVILNGGKDTRDGTKPQQAVIEFLCQKGLSKPRELPHTREDEGEGDEGNGDKPKPEWEAAKTTEDGHGGNLTFISYGDDGERGTLRLEWHTKYACQDYDGSDGDTEPGPPANGGGWGFFSWLFFLGFLGLIGYFVFFAWINFNKYGATGWDLVPHADAIRDLPYVLGEWSRKVMSTVTGGPSRGGYSAV